MNGNCDVPGCTDETFMGWRPLTEKRGRQICKTHWNRHKDSKDDFSLFDVLGFKPPERIPTRPAQKLSRSVPARALVSEPPRTTPQCPEETTANERFERSIKNRDSGCRACGGEREPGFTYCKSCGKDRRRRAHRERQHRYRQRA